MNVRYMNVRYTAALAAMNVCSNICKAKHMCAATYVKQNTRLDSNNQHLLQQQMREATHMHWQP